MMFVVIPPDGETVDLPVRMIDVVPTLSPLLWAQVVGRATFEAPDTIKPRPLTSRTESQGLRAIRPEDIK